MKFSSLDSVLIELEEIELVEFVMWQTLSLSFSRSLNERHEQGSRVATVPTAQYSPARLS